MLSTPSNVQDDYVLNQISPLTDDQVRILSILTIASATLSVLGSFTIILKVVANRRESSPYDRIMLGLSVSDILLSCSYALGPFLIPSDSSERIWAMGNAASCSFLGWLTQLALSAIWYNALLSFYYLLTVRFGISRLVFARRYEKYFHGLTLLFFASTATAGSVLDIFGEFEVSQGCWVGEIPKGCGAAGTCTGAGQIVGWVFGGIWIAFAYIAVLVNNIVVYLHVRKSLQLKGVPTLITETLSADAGRDSSVQTSFLSLVSAKGSAGSNSILIGIATDMEDILDPELEERALRNMAHVREVASQGFFYVGCFVISFSPAFVIRVMDSAGYGPSDEGNLYPLLLASSFLGPLQGFFNMIVHTRPSYNRFRAAYPELSWFWAVRRACLDHDIPRYSDAQMSSVRSRSSLNRAPSDANSKSVKIKARSFASDLIPVQEVVEGVESLTNRTGARETPIWADGMVGGRRIDEAEEGSEEVHQQQMSVEVVLQQHELILPGDFVTTEKNMMTSSSLPFGRNESNSKKKTEHAVVDDNALNHGLKSPSRTESIYQRNKGGLQEPDADNVEEGSRLTRKERKAFPLEQDPDDFEERPRLIRKQSIRRKRDTVTEKTTPLTRKESKPKRKSSNVILQSTALNHSDMAEIQSPTRRMSKRNVSKLAFEDDDVVRTPLSKSSKAVAGAVGLDEIRSPTRKESKCKKCVDLMQDGMGEIRSPTRKESILEKNKEMAQGGLDATREPVRKDSKREKTKISDHNSSIKSLSKGSTHDGLDKICSPTRKASKRVKSKVFAHDGAGEGASLTRRESTIQKTKDQTQETLRDVRSPTRKDGKHEKMKEFTQHGLDEIRSPIRKESKREKTKELTQDGLDNVRSPTRKESKREKIKEMGKDGLDAIRLPTRKESKREKPKELTQDASDEIRSLARKESKREKMKELGKDGLDKIHSPTRKESKREKVNEPPQDGLDAIRSPTRKASERKKSQGLSLDELDKIRAPTRKVSKRDKGKGRDGSSGSHSVVQQENEIMTTKAEDELRETQSPKHKAHKHTSLRKSTDVECDYIPSERKSSTNHKPKSSMANLPEAVEEVSYAFAWLPTSKSMNNGSESDSEIEA